jgi:hypothetical protein
MTFQQRVTQVWAMLDACPDAWPVYRTLLEDARATGWPGPIQDHWELADLAVLVITAGR